MSIKRCIQKDGKDVWIEVAGGGSSKNSGEAINVSIKDSDDLYETTNVEGALNEIGYELQNLSNDLTNHKNDMNIHGGGGGGGSMPTITSDFTINKSDGVSEINIPIFFNSPNLGQGLAYVLVSNVEVATQTVQQGNNTIVVPPLGAGKNIVISIYVKDRANMLSNQLEWTIICGGIDLEVNFDDTADYGVTDEILMQFTVQSASSEPIIMHMTIDYDTYEIECNQGVNEYMFVGLGVGVHKVSFYLTSGEYLTPTTNYNIVVVSSNSLFVSSDFEGGEFTNGTPVAIQYRVSKASDEYFDVKLYLNDKLEKTLSVQAGTYYWTINDLDIGEYSIRI